MNSFDSAVARRLGKFINDECAAQTEVLLMGIATDFGDYQARVARIKAFNELANELKEIESELLRG